MKEKGFIPILILIGILILGLIGGGIYSFERMKNYQNDSIREQKQSSSNLVSATIKPSVDPISKQSFPKDEDIISTVNYYQANIKQYHAYKGVYPKNLSDLKNVMNINDNDIKIISNPPFSYTTSVENINYDFHAVLSTGEIFSGDIERINKHLDATVMADVSNLFSIVNGFYYKEQLLPRDLNGAMIILKDESSNGKSLEQPVNPNTGKQYVYLIKDDKKNFSISGILSNSREYKQESSF